MGWEVGADTFKGLILATLLFIGGYIRKKLRPTVKLIKRILDVSDRVDKMESEVMIVKGRQMALMYCDPKPMFLLNEKNEVKWVNPAWLELTGIASERDAMGFGYLRAIPEEDLEKMTEQSEVFKNHPGSFAGEVRFKNVKTGVVTNTFCRSEIVNVNERLVETVGILKPII